MRCDHCHQDIARSDPVYRTFGAYGTLRVICSECRNQAAWKHSKFWSPQPCVHCRRPVQQCLTRRKLRIPVCSQQCRIAFYNTRQREPAESRPCRVCGKAFKPKRHDAAYCSNACRRQLIGGGRTDSDGKRSCEQPRFPPPRMIAWAPSGQPGSQTSPVLGTG